MHRRYRLLKPLLLAAILALLLILLVPALVPRLLDASKPETNAVQRAVVGAITSAGSSAMAESGGTDVPAVPPQLAPDEFGYAQGQGGRSTASDGRLIAQLLNPPAALSQMVAANIPESTTMDENVVAFSMSSSIKYSGGGHTVLVTTSRASKAAVQAGYELGSKKLQQPDGSTLWVTTGYPSEYPNQVVWEKDGLIITVASDLPLDQVRSLAKGVVVAR